MTTLNFDLSNLPKPIEPAHATLIYGANGTKKTTFMSQIPASFYMDLEQGIMTLVNSGAIKKPDHVVTPVTTSEVKGWLEALANQPHQFRNVVVDSLSQFCKIAEQEIITKYGGASLNDKHRDGLAYGNGTSALIRIIETHLIAPLNALRERGVKVWMSCHALNKAEGDALGESMDKWKPDLQERVFTAVKPFYDNFLFVKQEFSKENKRDMGRIVMYTEEMAGAFAKNRLSLPAMIPDPRITDVNSSLFTTGDVTFELFCKSVKTRNT